GIGTHSRHDGHLLWIRTAPWLLAHGSARPRADAGHGWPARAVGGRWAHLGHRGPETGFDVLRERWGTRRPPRFDGGGPGRDWRSRHGDPRRSIAGGVLRRALLALRRVRGCWTVRPRPGSRACPGVRSHERGRQPG